MVAPSEASATPAQRAYAVASGVACHVTFIIAVGAMIGAMGFGMSRSLGRVLPPWDGPANLGLLLQFPIMHSLLLTRVGGKLLKRLSPASIAGTMATTTYALVASVQVLLLFVFWTPSGIVWWRADGAMLWMCLTLYAASWLLLLKSIWDAGFAVQTGFLGWWAVSHNRRPVYPPMPATGLFRLIRQPIYVAFALTLWTVPVWTPDQLLVAIVLTAYCVIGPLFKEKRFRQRFGAAFASYVSSTPYWLPWPRPRPLRALNDLALYDTTDWWDGKRRWQRTLQNMVPARFAAFDAIVGNWEGKAVLDLGCGGGFMAEALARRRANVYGVDPSEAAIAAAQRHASASGLKVDYATGTGEAIPHADQTFDIVVCVDVLEHVTDLDRVIAEIDRVLRPGGLLLFDTINQGWLAGFVLVTLAETIVRLIPPGTHDPAMFIPPEALSARLQSHGFVVGRFEGLGPRGMDRRGDLTFGRSPILAIQYLGSARKAA